MAELCENTDFNSEYDIIDQIVWHSSVASVSITDDQTGSLVATYHVNIVNSIVYKAEVADILAEKLIVLDTNTESRRSVKPNFAVVWHYDHITNKTFIHMQRGNHSIINLSELCLHFDKNYNGEHVTTAVLCIEGNGINSIFS